MNGLQASPKKGQTLIEPLLFKAYYNVLFNARHQPN